MGHSSRLDGASVLVVGGSSGMGLASAAAAIEAGAAITIAGRSEEKLARASRALGGCETICLDVREEAQVARLLGAAGPFDHVVVTAGSVAPSPVRSGLSDRPRAGFDSKFWGAWHVAAHAPIAALGSLTLISGVFAVRPQKGMVAASCVNAAIDALARALALELAPVRVNAISPGLIDTPMWDGMKPERKAAFFADAAASLPGQYIGRAGDIAALVLACMLNPLVTGSIVVADGGRTLV